MRNEIVHEYSDVDLSLMLERRQPLMRNTFYSTSGLRGRCLSVRYTVLDNVSIWRSLMPLLRPSTDVRPVTEFRANTSSVLDQVHATKRPVILTQHGRSAAVLMDVDVYEGLLDEVALLRAVRTGEEQLAAGEVIAHEDVEARIRARLAK
jgi:prevent-host-death family protein